MSRQLNKLTYSKAQLGRLSRRGLILANRLVLQNRPLMRCIGFVLSPAIFFSDFLSDFAVMDVLTENCLNN